MTELSTTHKSASAELTQQQQEQFREICAHRQNAAAEMLAVNTYGERATEKLKNITGGEPKLPGKPIG